MRRLPIVVVSAWAVCLAVAGCVSTVEGTAVGTRRGAPVTEATTAAGLPGLLLSLDEMKDILKFSGMVKEWTSTRPDGQGIFEPAACVGAVFSGMAPSYDASGYGGYFEVRLQDVTPTTPERYHWVDQGVATFENPEAARAFVSKQVAQWRRCTGQRFTYAFPDPDDWREPYIIGEPVESGCATTISNVIVGDKRYDDIRVLAARSNIVVDLQFTGFDLTDEPATTITQILDRIVARGRDCAFWG